VVSASNLRDPCGIDRQSYPGVDVVTDLEGPLPIDDDAFDHVFAIHVLEHIRDLVGLMNELHRILRPTGVLHVLTPLLASCKRHRRPNTRAVYGYTNFQVLLPGAFRMQCWETLMVSVSPDTVFADLQPLKNGSSSSRSQIARWFY